MQVQKNQYMNRSEILERALGVAKKVHEIAVWTVRQSTPLADYFEMPNFEIEWLKNEIKRLWGIEIVREEAEYLWLKSVVGF
jgi:uncharacterized protein YqgQ